ncbi:EAL domain-containing protein [Armatimonas sp.]|uniref:bifunctional diguanylate cyclase/phosphodiesterase n=1 Tax=Armatimonas sp. TaxID=1872638 RepID=UPI00286A2B46|nr:EAL domain-containing protein [Armatimonas sp.]
MILLNELPCAALITDERGSVMRVNDALRAIVGGTEDTWCNQPMEMLFPPASRIFLQTHLWPLLLREESVREAVLQLRNLENNMLPVLVNARKSTYEGVTAYYWTLFVTQNRSQFEAELLSARRAAETAAQQLAQSQQFVRSVTDAIPELIAYWDKELICRFANQAYLEWYGKKPEELLGSRLQDLRGGHLFELNQREILGALAGEPQQFERPIPNINGKPGHKLANYIPDIHPETGEVLGFLASIADVSALKRAQNLLERMGRVAGVGGWEVDLGTGSLLWTDEVRRIHGIDSDFTPTLAEAIAFYEPSSVPIIEAAVARGMAGGPGYDLELQIIRRDGARRWVRAVGSVEFEGDKPVRLIGAFQDITEYRRLTAELAEQHELLRVTLQSIGDAVITTDATGHVTWLNPVAERMTGWQVEEAKGQLLDQVFQIVNEETRQATENPVMVALQKGKVVGLTNHTLLISRHGEEFGIEDSAAPIRNESGEILGVVLVFHDVTEQRRLSGEMSYRATHDTLTGLVNRAEFDTRLRRTLHQAHEDRGEHTLLFIDLDQFKLVNDACGHSAGDQLLQQVAKLLGESVRARDTLARLGGDEFGVLLEHCTSEQAGRVAEQICERMNDYRFIHDERRFRIGTSIGLVPVDSRWSNTSAIVQAADSSCYAAKDAGRNRVHVWLDSDQAIRTRQGEMQWATRLEQALDEDRFQLYAQRIHTLDTTAPLQGLHAEVLLRMVERDGSLVAPGVFLPAAERFYLASRIDQWVLRHAIAWLSSLKNISLVDTLCVNVSGQSIGDRVFHRQAIEIFTEAGPDICKRLCLEITETAAVTHMADAALFITQVRALKVRIALDDFGAGASSFGYLKNLSVDVLKIDGQFIRNLTEDRLNDATVRCFVEVAQVIGVKTIAEFVDRPETLARVREIGVDFAQGYLLHQPEPIENVLTA